ncbi:MAG: DUF4926 domain-containing protein [Timaviella obliquedivisa GSE-PSE-MK23-08B]|nr:DUF4926 domain-containing protein [Timaviella obliquedivisa GSE-PSE-MK23-08B]
MIRELDMVTLTRDVQEPQLLKGSRGAVVHCYGDGQGFEVEFVQETGETIAVLTLERSDIQPEREMIQAQVLAILNVLPDELLAEVRDFAEFLQQRKVG